MKILVVEDTYIAQKMIESMFVRQGCEVEIADNGYQGLEKALKSKYDVIFPLEISRTMVHNLIG